MTFWIKKLISNLLLPLPFGLFWVAIGILILLSKRARRLGIISVIAGFFTICLFALNPLSSTLLHTLQSEYTPLTTPPANVDTIVVLGGGVSGGKDYPPNLTLSASSLSRLIEGIRLLKLTEKNHPNAKLILSGGRVFQSPAVAGKMQNTALMLGIAEKNTSLEDGSRDTREEALFLQKMLGDKPFILVTSAFHMPRAMALFQHLGMHPIAAPTQFLAQHYNPLFWYIPNANSLIYSDLAIHEYLGMMWAKMQGDINK